MKEGGHSAPGSQVYALDFTIKMTAEGKMGAFCLQFRICFSYISVLFREIGQLAQSTDGRRS